MKELIAPVVGSTLTTVVVFVPLGMLSGVVGQFFRALSITLAAAVLISLVQALTLIPLLAQWAAKSREKHGRRRARAPRPACWSASTRATLDSTMRRPILGIVVALLLAVAGGFLFMRLGSGFLPEADEGGFVIDYNAPPGSALPDIDRVVRKIEGVLQEDAGGRGLHAPHRIGARALRDAADQGRHPRPAEAGRRAAGRPTRSSTTCATS